MNSKVRLASIATASFLLIGAGARIAGSKARPERGKQSAPTQHNGNAVPAKKTTSVAGCPLLSPTLLAKVLGGTFAAQPRQKAMPMYGGAWGWSCTYGSIVPSSSAPNGEYFEVRVDYSVYVEASLAEAKHTFSTYAIVADPSAGKPSIGDAAYWVTNDKQEPYIFVLKGKTHFSLGITPANRGQLKQLAAAVAGKI